MTDLDVDAVWKRYRAALDARPAKGDWTRDGIAALADSVSDVPDLLAHLEAAEQERDALGTPKTYATAEELDECEWWTVVGAYSAVIGGYVACLKVDNPSCWFVAGATARLTSHHVIRLFGPVTELRHGRMPIDV